MKEVVFSREWDYYKDQISGFYNRHALIEYLEQHSSSRMTIFVVNIDNFSAYNRLYGYLISDEILKEVATGLDMLKLSHMHFFRFDGDEFVFLTHQFMNFREIEEFSMGVISFFNQTEVEVKKLEQTSLKVSVSIGVAMGNGIITLSHAQTAIKEARRNSKGAYKLFTAKEGYNKEQQENVYWINKIKKAIEDEKIISYYQPIKNVKTGKIEKFECLARIKDDDIVISPIRFMEAARITGTHSLITRSIIKTAFKEFSGNDYEFSINITASDIRLGYLEEFLMFHVEKYNIEPSRIVLEILEDIVTLTEGNMVEQIERFRKIGFKVAIDDFGMENSNFSRLIEFHPDLLKIDGVFIKDILTSRKSQIIVDAILDVCRKSGIKVVAEFVSDEKIYEYVKNIGIDYVQGYYIGAPLAHTKEVASDE